jgi:hypothetical protein
MSGGGAGHGAGWSDPDAAAIAVGTLCQRTVEGQLDSFTPLLRRTGLVTARGTVPRGSGGRALGDPERATSPSVRSA